MNAAWEWRAFQPRTSGSLLEATASLAGRLGVAAPTHIAAEADTYLVMSRLPHNIKLRRGSLEIKQKRAQRAGGYSLWLDKAVFTFPLSGEQAAGLWDLMPARRRPPSLALQSAHHLMTVLGQQYPDLSVVHLYKQRVRLDVGEARLEVVDLEIPGLSRWLSYCADGYSLQAVQDLVQLSGLRHGLKVMSYVDFLQEALWWFPALVGGGAPVHGRQAP